MATKFNSRELTLISSNINFNGIKLKTDTIEEEIVHSIATGLLQVFDKYGPEVLRLDLTELCTLSDVPLGTLRDNCCNVTGSLSVCEGAFISMSHTTVKEVVDKPLRITEPTRDGLIYDYQGALQSLCLNDVTWQDLIRLMLRRPNDEVWFDAFKPFYSRIFFYGVENLSDDQRRDLGYELTDLIKNSLRTWCRSEFSVYKKKEFENDFLQHLEWVEEKIGIKKRK